MYTLVVVDMQPMFSTSQKLRTKAAVNRLLKKAIKDNAPIIFLEYTRYGRTDPALLATVEGYESVHFRTKHTDDGSEEVHEVINAHNLPKKIRICGVNTNYCVRATIMGLLDKFPMTGIAESIEVHEKACNSSWAHDLAIEDFKYLDQVSVV